MLKKHYFKEFQTRAAAIGRPSSFHLRRDSVIVSLMLISYLWILSNTSAKNYRNRIVYVKPQKWGWWLLYPFTLGELGPHLTQCGLGRDLPPYQVAPWSIKPFGMHNAPTLQTGQTDMTTVRSQGGEPSYKRSPKNKREVNYTWASSALLLLLRC